MPGVILTVDDSASMRQMVRFTLEAAGYQVLQAADGVEVGGGRVVPGPRGGVREMHGRAASASVR